MAVLEGHAGAISSVYVNESGCTAVSFSCDDGVMVWDLTRLKLEQKLQIAGQQIRMMCSSRDLSTLAVMSKLEGERLGTVHVWQS